GSRMKATAFLSNGSRFVYNDGFCLNGFGKPDVAIVGDFNGDGLDDLLWYEKARAKATAFLSNGKRFVYNGGFCLNGFG
ncbi:MAG: hypothetical protein K8R74_09665, partial [Bacteroidales bacterium]|nr:hypothetical protein [Bacteroidales bacterium]